MTMLYVGRKVVMDCEGSGDVDDEEVFYKPGELGTIASISWYEHQGVAIGIDMDCGVFNSFDQLDTPPLYPFHLTT